MKRKLTRYLLCGLLPAALLHSVSKASTPRHQTADTVMVKNVIPAKPTDISPLLIGESIPVVVLPDADGKSYNLNTKISERPTILVFTVEAGAPSAIRNWQGYRLFKPTCLKWVIN